MRGHLPIVALVLVACPAPVTGELPSNDWPSIEPRWDGYEGTGSNVGDALVGFRLPDQTGAAVDFRQFLGSVVVVEVGATWCVPCQQAALTQQALQDELSAEGPVWILTVLVQDVSGGPPDIGDAAAWAQQFGLQTAVMADLVQEQQTAWSIDTWPTTLVVAPDGTVLHRHEVAIDEATLASQVRAALVDHANDLRTDE